jgi:hypothetical protein
VKASGSGVDLAKPCKSDDTKSFSTSIPSGVFVIVAEASITAYNPSACAVRTLSCQGVSQQESHRTAMNGDVRVQIQMWRIWLVMAASIIEPSSRAAVVVRATRASSFPSPCAVEIVQRMF